MKISFVVDRKWVLTEAHALETEVAAALEHHGSNDEYKDCNVGWGPLSTLEHLQRENNKLGANS